VILSLPHHIDPAEWLIFFIMNTSSRLLTKKKVGLEETSRAFSQFGVLFELMISSYENYFQTFEISCI
jgi:hypothetical protein